MTIDDPQLAQIAQLRHERDLLAEALGKLLVHLGYANNVPMTGPQLLVTVESALDDLPSKGLR